MLRNPEEVKKDIVDTLYWDTRVDASDIQVEVNGDEVTLAGTVPNYFAYWAAEDDARIVRGVRTIRNYTRIRVPPELTLPSDEEIQTYIQNIFAANPSIDETRIDVVVNDGEVTLQGATDTYWQRLRAEQLALDITGVRSIINEVTIVPTEDVVDEAIADEIIQVLERNADIVTDAVTVKVENGVVTLSGTVPGWYALQYVRETAYHTRGVVDVKDSLMIEETS